MNRNFAVFSSARRIRMEDQSYQENLAWRIFQETDPPEPMKTRIKVAKGEFDAVKKITRQLPTRIFGRILGAPQEDLPWLVQKGDELIANTNPDFTDNVQDKMTTDEYRMMPFNSPAGAELFECPQRIRR